MREEKPNTGNPRKISVHINNNVRVNEKMCSIDSPKTGCPSTVGKNSLWINSC
jgi:hypothetical protein